MSAYEDHADALAEHVYPCDDDYCQICYDMECALEPGSEDDPADIDDGFYPSEEDL